MPCKGEYIEYCEYCPYRVGCPIYEENKEDGEEVEE